MQPLHQHDPARRNPELNAAPGEFPISRLPEYAYRVAIVAAVVLLLWTAV